MVIRRDREAIAPHYVRYYGKFNLFDLKHFDWITANEIVSWNIYEYWINFPDVAFIFCRSRRLSTAWNALNNLFCTCNDSWFQKTNPDIISGNFLEQRAYFINAM